MLGAIVVGLVLVSYQRVLLAWQSMLGLILLIILFIPIRRYTVGGSLPIELEPYRIVIAVVLGCWFCALAADPKVRWRGTGSKPRWPRWWWRCSCRWPRTSGASTSTARSSSRTSRSSSATSWSSTSSRASSARARPRPHVQDACRRRRDRGVPVAGRVEDRHQLLQLVQPRSAVPALRRRGRCRRAGHGRPRPRLCPAPDRAQRGAGDAHAARRLPVPALSQADLAGLRRRCSRSARSRPARGRARRC